jgi:hypothetical protein
MALCVDVVANAVVLVAGQTEATCTTYLLSTATQSRFLNALTDLTTLNLMGIDAASIAYVYAWGFGSVLSVWAMGYAVGVCLTLIRKV